MAPEPALTEEIVSIVQNDVAVGTSDTERLDRGTTKLSRGPRRSFGGNLRERFSDMCITNGRRGLQTLMLRNSVSIDELSFSKLV